jgi:putative FmdB family regulatory protein
MPIYEYRCSSCGTEHEALQKFSDAPLSVCPSCQKSTLTKLVSAAGFQLKGSGWYATDFRNGSKPAAKTNGADGKASATETKGDGASSDAKSTETKSEAAAPASCGTNCGCH